VVQGRRHIASGADAHCGGDAGVPPRERLRADCTSCFGLCCVAPAFSASADFAIDKAAGQACPNLRADSRCSIHSRLRERGFPGCVAYDCFGAGQQVAQITFGGTDWRTSPRIATQMFTVFRVMRDLYELLWYLTEAATLRPARPLRGELRRALDETARLTRLRPDVLAELDVEGHRRKVGALLRRASEFVRAEFARPRARAALSGADPAGAHPPGAERARGDPAAANLAGADRTAANLAGAGLARADLVGKRLRGADLRGADLRGASLIGADFRGADLRLADLLGADCRALDLRGADLSTSIFVTRSQLGAAKGDRDTRLPPSLDRPAHWR
jgi:uncharacterized protein YjbI with pentapeptide repeats